MGGVIIFAILFCVLLAYYFFHVLPNEKEKEAKAEEERRKEQTLYEEEKARDNQIWWAKNYFGIELDTLSEISTQDEIVRLVNILAHAIAIECVKQDKSHRGELISCNSTYSINHDKEEWAEQRDFALKIAPHLKKRIPHFSEFEPLKSYNAEHLIK